ncbi:TIGR02270 family protein [Corallococcus sp. BB11-1]|uniref:TIGR02270 family protein n=1 Tax=Corallococcus sp. BB11-1 TaxID=2996783 RepID=UPI002270E7D8|nr:TIGR02270 family protein [Corallococcus sp. BB11-1]MCY1034027.1 TIGR02270 family protein [Corallococcus sp. BB11-1]
MADRPIPPGPRGARRILWDVLEEHLDEASFLWRQRERSLLAPDERLEDLAGGEEARLLAHLGGLVTGGRAAAGRLLWPALAAEEPERVGAAAWSLMASREEDRTPSVLEALGTAEDAQRAGLLRALELGERTGLEGALLRVAPGLEALPQAGVLEVLVHRGADVTPLLARLAPGGPTPLHRAALRAARLVPTPLAMAWVRGAMEDAPPSLQDAARVAGLIHHLREPWLRCRKEVEQGRVRGRVPLLALAISGGPRETEALVRGLEWPQLREEVLWALGFCGRLSAAEALLDIIRDEGSWAAADSFATITGLPLEEPRFLERVPEDEEPAEEGEAGGGGDEAELPGPGVLAMKVHAAQVEAWWREARPRFEDRGRYLLGRPWSPEGLVAALEEVSMRRRPVLAWELAVRSQGACQVEPRAWTWVQRAALSRAKGVRMSVQPFEAFMTGNA